MMTKETDMLMLLLMEAYLEGWDTGVNHEAYSSDQIRADWCNSSISTDKETRLKILDLGRKLHEHGIYKDRYELVRTLNPREYHDLWDENLRTGKRFDLLVDELVAARHFDQE